ncbi:MAG: hypothetical protein B0W54_02370 [Cellvibrio sp. 79]|nr:MAG: hypothetical protein B0W54_02370 [Cellvibrio sp. 79]
MTSASNQQITRCPKCGTAFRITQTQLQSANGAVRCGSCLNVFKAMDYLVAPVAAKPSETSKTINTAPEVPTAAAKNSLPVGNTPLPNKPADASNTSKPATQPTVVSENKVATPKPAPVNKPEQLAILSTIKPLPINPAPVVTTAKPTPKPESQKSVIRTLDKSSLEKADDILISDDMDDTKSETKSYEFDSFMDIDTTPKAEVSLFERKIRHQNDADELHSADESWAEMLIDDEGDDTPKFAAQRTQVINTEEDDFYATERTPEPPATHEIEKKPEPAKNSPSLMFSLIDEPEQSDSTKPAAETTHQKADDDFVLSDELASIPDHSGFKSPLAAQEEPLLDPSLFETPDNTTSDDSPKRQVKTQPKIRAYDGSRTALLMNIIPAPIEFTAKRMRRWYQRILWPALSLVALVALIAQLAWFSFDYFSRVEPYRTAYAILCPYFKCQLPSLVDTRQISAFNLVVREHPETAGALAVDVMIMNNAPFDQPYPDLVLMFTDIDENEVASRRFSPKEYLGGEAAGSSHMPQKQPVHLTLDLVDPGEKAVNYHIYIPRQ